MNRSMNYYAAYRFYGFIRYWDKVSFRLAEK